MANRFLNNIKINDSYELPPADGTENQIIVTDGAGNLSFNDLSAVSGAVEGVQSDIIYYEVKNSTGTTIETFKGVMAVGTDGNSGHILIDEMVADGTVEARYFLGITQAAIPNGGIGRVIAFGEIDQVNTNAFLDGTILWCDPASPGNFTATEPDGPNLKIPAAFVLNQATNGKIQVRVQGHEGIKDLYDTKITSQVDGDVLVWKDTEGIWQNDSTLNVDYAAGNIGIGTTDPDTKLDVVGRAVIGTGNTLTNATNATVIGNSNNLTSDSIVDANTNLVLGDYGAGRYGNTVISDRTLRLGRADVISATSSNTTGILNFNDSVEANSAFSNVGGLVGYFPPPTTTNDYYFISAFSENVNGSAFQTGASPTASRYNMSTSPSLSCIGQKFDANTTNGGAVYINASNNSPTPSSRGIVTFDIRHQNQNYTVPDGHALFEVTSGYGQTKFIIKQVSGSTNVGIGTTNPSEKLNVSGNILATGTITGSNLSGTNTGDQDLSGYALTSHNHNGVYQPAGTYNTIIGTDSDIDTSGATIIDNIYVTDGVITSMGTRTLTIGDIGAAAASHNHDDRYYTEAESDSRFVNATGDTMTGTLTASGGINGLTLSNGISGSNFDITGVNQIRINDPGEGIVWTNGSSGDITLATVDDSSDNILRLSGTGASLQVGTSTVWHAGNDGSGSGLDADLLDGKQPPTNFSATSQSYTTIPNGGWSLPTGSSVFSKSDSVGGVGDDGYWFVTGRRDTGGGYSGIYTPHSNGTAWLGMALTGTANPTWWKIWTSGNDGSGSGLDADTLDGQHASAFLTSYSETDTLDSVADRGRTTNQQLISTNPSGFRVDSGSTARIEIDSNNNWSYIRLQDNGVVSWDIASNNGGALELRPGGGGTNRTYFDASGNSYSEGSKRAPIFYDSNNTSYYLDPASSSVVNDLRGTRIWAGYDANVDNSISCSEWFRSSGNTGWYNASYGGGIYMVDSTWVRVYNNKKFYANNTIESNTGMYAPIFYDRNDTNYYVNPASTSNLNTVTISGYLQSKLIQYQSTNWRKNYFVRSVGVTGSEIGDKWVHLMTVTNTSGYAKFKAKFKIDGYDDVSSGEERIDVIYENASTGQENHQCFWGGGDGLSSLFKEVKSIRTSSSGLNNTYQVWVKMEGDWRDTFTVEVEWFSSAGTTPTFPTSIGTTTNPAGNNDISKTYRALHFSSALEFGPPTDTSDRGIIHYGSSGKIGQASTFDPNNGQNGFWIEGTQDNESGGIFMNGNTFALWSPGDADILNVYDEDAFSAGPKFIVSGNGTVQAAGPVYGTVFYDKNNSTYYMDGSSTGDSIRVAGDVVAYYSSDKRYKDNIKPIENALDKVKAINGVTFNWNEKSHKETGKKDVGVIAQEVEEVFPEIVETRTNGYKAVDYQKLTAVLIESVKELTAKVEALEAKQCNCK